MSGETGIQEQIVEDVGGAGAPSGLAIVASELMETIRNAHLALEDCVDGRGGSAALVRAGELLHQVRGALQITETYGAALLTEEMELGCKYLAGLRAGKGREDGLDALTRSMVQLPSYIERLLGGGREAQLHAVVGRYGHPPPGRGRIALALAFGVTVHTIFAAAVLALLAVLFSSGTTVVMTAVAFLASTTFAGDEWREPLRQWLERTDDAVLRSYRERLYREIRALRIYEGTSEIQRIVISKNVLEEYEQMYPV